MPREIVRNDIIRMCVDAIDWQKKGTADNRSDRHTRRIHGKVNLGVEPPFVRLIS